MLNVRAEILALRARAMFLCFLMSKGNWGLAGTQRPQDSFTSKKYKGFLGNAVVPPSSPFVDNLFDPGFTVPITSTQNVSGGGAALNAAVAAAPAGREIVVTDSMNYSQVVFTGKTNITIRAATGQTPTITAAAGTSQSAVRIGAGNSGIALIGLTLIGNGNLNLLSAPDNGILLGTVTVTGMATFDRLIVDRCDFQELVPASGVPGIQLVGTDGLSHTNVWIKHCTFTDCSTPAFGTGAGYGACTVGGFNTVVVQNSKIQRVTVARATSNMRGVVCKNLDTTVEDVLCFDIGSGGSNESFKHNEEASFGSAVGNSTWRNNVAFNAKRGFRMTLTGGGMKVNHGTVYNTVAGIAAGQIFFRRDNAPTIFLVENSVLQGAGDGTAFSATASENHNDIFNVAAPGKVLDGTDLTINPLLSDPVNNDYRATAPAVVSGGAFGFPMGVYYPGGTVIFWAGVP
jgi:hypothetical protein